MTGRAEVVNVRRMLLGDDPLSSRDLRGRCALAHSMADVQDDVQEELIWDLRALAAADLVSDERGALAGVLSPVAAFYPSLHLNLGECYRRIGNLELAREHLKRALDAVVALRDDGCGRMIKGGLARPPWATPHISVTGQGSRCVDRHDQPRRHPSVSLAVRISGNRP